MGFIKQIAAKLTGADVAADSADRAGEVQAAATRQAGERAAQGAREAAAQVARQAEQNAAREAAQGAASDALSKPIENADVNLSAPSNESVSGAARKRRTTFGIGSANSGVNI